MTRNSVSRFLSAFLCIFLVLSMMSSTTLAASKITGTCGEKARWTYNTKTDTLTISGKGVAERPYDDWLETPTGHGSIDSVTKTIVIKKGITGIGDWCFAEMINLKSVKIPSSVRTIGEQAFYDCHNLKKVSMEKGVKTIEYEAFGECLDLKSIKLPGSIKTIGEYAFMSCPMKSVSIPNSVNKIDKKAFGYYSDCVRDHKITYYKVKGFTIRGKKKSAAQKYAKSNGFKFKGA